PVVFCDLVTLAGYYSCPDGSTVFKSVSMNGEQLIILNCSLRSFASLLATSFVHEHDPRHVYQDDFPGGFLMVRAGRFQFSVGCRVDCAVQSKSDSFSTLLIFSDSQHFRRAPLHLPRYRAMPAPAS